MYDTLPYVYDTIKTMFFNIHIQIIRGGDPQDQPLPLPPPKKNVVEFMKQNKMYIVKTNTLYNNERYVYYLPIKIIFFLVLVGYSINYVFDFSNVVLQSLINLRSFKMYMYFIYQLYGYRRINELNCNLIDRLI